ncbi:unnamed protein product [Lathyrus oleraceus]
MSVLQNILKARADLQHAQQDLLNDRMNCHKIEEIKKHTEDLVKWNELEENILKNNAKSIRVLHKDDGNTITSQDEIEEVVLDYYGSLIGESDNNLTHIDVAAMREGDQLNVNQRGSIVALVNEKQILSTLHDISDMKALGIDAYGARFFKASWQNIKGDVIATMMDLFQNERLFRAVNYTVVTLIPKSEEATSIIDHRPIAGCTTMYKIISKVLTARLCKVIGSIVGSCQATFVPGQQIHNHILLAYELTKGYSKKGASLDV